MDQFYTSKDFADYENLLYETKIYLNKAMDVFATIKDKQIRDFNEVDKFILSLLTASFFVEGELKACLTNPKINHDEVKLEDIFRFMEITQKDIKPLYSDYHYFYDQYFKEYLEEMEQLNVKSWEQQKTPMVIFSYFDHPLVLDSNILNRFSEYINLDNAIFNETHYFKSSQLYFSINGMRNKIQKSIDTYDSLEHYSKLMPSTQEYIGKAMEIYNVLRNKKDSLSDTDKVVISLFIASYFGDGDLKSMIERACPIKYDDVLKFVGLEEKDIKPLDTSYDTFYYLHFESQLKSMEKAHPLEGYSKNPLVIFNYLNDILVNGSNILNELCRYCNLSNSYFKDLDVVQLVRINIEVNHALYNKNTKNAKGRFSDYKDIDGLPEDRISEKISSIKTDVSKIKANVGKMRVPAFGSFKSTGSSQRNLEDKEQKLEYDEVKNNIQEDSDEKLKELEYYESDEIWDILEDIKKKFIGQEQAVEDLFYNIVNNQRMILEGNLEDGERSMIFLDGPTGTGKTAIIREITKRLNIPYHRSTITNYSPTGYVGDNISENLKALVKEADSDINKAERGIIVFDEFDKIVYNPDDGDNLELKKAVQQQLLDFMGGGSYKVPIMQSIFGSVMGNFDTSKLTFICLGALTNLRDKKGTPKKSMGFNASISGEKVESYEITPQDLIDLGYERELVGRFNTYLHTEEYSKEVLERILRESSISPILGFKKWVNTYHKTLVIDDEVYGVIAEEAYKLNTGARSLQTVLNNTRTLYLKEVMRSKEDTIYLDVESVRKACKNSVTRKSRI